MDRYVVTILPGGRITIPAAIRRELDLQPGDSLTWREQDGDMYFRKVESGGLPSRDNCPSSEETVLCDIDHDSMESQE